MSGRIFRFVDDNGPILVGGAIILLLVVAAATDSDSDPAFKLVIGRTGCCPCAAEAAYVADLERSFDNPWVHDEVLGVTTERAAAAAALTDCIQRELAR
ncbi:MAG: hypothetical protein OXH38_11755 [Chloroflexi bacterium]|nr:hypothetical protein [Chloroflexota bacterium]